MIKGDLIENVAKKADLSKAKAAIAVNEVFDSISASLKKGKSNVTFFCLLPFCFFLGGEFPSWVDGQER